MRTPPIRLLVATFLVLCGCAPPGAGPISDRDPGWPYAGVQSRTRVPAELIGQPIFTGRWIAADAEGVAAYTETSEARYFCRVPFDDPHRLQFLDLGVGAEVETIGFLPRDRSLLLVGAVMSPHHREAVVVRSLLEVDSETLALVGMVPLPRDGRARGLAIDAYRRRVFLLDDTAGSGEVVAIDLYGGRRVARASAGIVPASVERKGLAGDEDGRVLFCLAGGEGVRSDFQPIGGDTADAPHLVVFEAEGLTVRARVPLDPGFEPRAVAYDDDRSRAYVLEARRDRSRLVVVDGNFDTVRSRIDLPEATTDLVLSGGFAFMPGSYGIYIVDLDLESLISRPTQFFDLTGEMAVSAAGSTALVLYQSARSGGIPGLAVLSLQTGALLDVLQ